MSVYEEPLNSSLILQYQAGTTPAGAPILRQKSLNYVRPGADIEHLYSAAHGLMDLVDHELLHVFLRRNSELIELG